MTVDEAQVNPDSVTSIITAFCEPTRVYLILGLVDHLLAHNLHCMLTEN